jgi:hypothetical protein
MQGRPIHEWTIDWFTIWPNATHIPRKITPRSRPGTHVDGAVVMPNGDIVFNFEHLGLVRLDPSGSRGDWYQTHHSVHSTTTGLWVSGRRITPSATRDFRTGSRHSTTYWQSRSRPTASSCESGLSTICWSRTGGAACSTRLAEEHGAEASGDLLHLNDVEPFPSTMTPGFFGPGDVLVSLRNVNTVLVFNTDTRKIKFVITGRFTRQHDPDFIDGNRFSVFDNMGVQPGAKDRQSRIVIVTAPEQSVQVLRDARAPLLHRYHGETSVAARRQPARHGAAPRTGIRDQPAG